MMIFRLLAILVVVLSTFAVHARDNSPISTFGVDTSVAPAPGHGWTLQFDAELKDWILVHIPPRGGVGLPAAEDGSIRQVLRLSATPAKLVGLAAVEDSVYVLLDDIIDGIPQRRVMMTRAVKAGLGYVYDPAGRLASVPKLDATGEIEGFSGTCLGPAIAIGGSPPETRVVKILVNGKWLSYPIPRNLMAAGSLTLVPDQSGRLALFNTQTRELFLSTPRLESKVEKDSAEPAFMTPQWSSRQLGSLPSGTEIIAVLGTEVLASDSSSGVINLLRGGQTVRTLTTVAAAPSGAAVVVLPASGRAVVLWSEIKTLPGGKVAQHTELSELSIHLGTEFYRGPLRKPAPISVDDLRLLVVLLIAFMGSILVVLLRPIPKGIEPVLPEGASLAEPSRRVLAGLLDFAIASTITLKAFDVSIENLTSINLWLSMTGIEMVLSIFIVGFILSTMGESMIGRSLGKLFSGCEVISLRKVEGVEGEQATFRQILIRNAIKWLIPPIGMSILFDSNLRHRGDLLSGTAVVVWAPEEEDESDGPG